MLAGVYRIPRIAYRGRSVVTNATPVGACRGAGRPEAAACVERAMDMLAQELAIDPVELRRENLIPVDAFPFTPATGTTYDSGDYVAPLDRVLEMAGYEDLRKEQAARRERGDPSLLGIGVSTYVEITSFSSKEFARVDIEDDGRVTVYAGTSSHGQGHETAFAQLAAGVLGVAIEGVRVIHSDTALVERGEGTWGSRSLQAGGSSVAARAVDDCGRILNPALVRGQQHGGIAQGIAQALFEEVVFDDVGNPVTGTLATYLMPSAADLPTLETATTETPTHVNPLGAKGIGESGSIGSTPAVQNAVVDALSHLGVRHVDLPCSPERVRAAITNG